MSTQLIRALPLVVPTPSTSASEPATLIFLHGYNSTALRFNCTPPNDQSLAHHIHSSPALHHIKIIIANGLPCIHPQVRENVWYNLSKPFPQPGDAHRATEEIEHPSQEGREEDVTLTMDYIEELIRDEMALRTPAGRIVLMGYSQGATMAALFVLTRRLGAELGAVVSLAGFAPVPMADVVRMQKENGLGNRRSRDTSLFLVHGKEDRHIPVAIHHAWLARIGRVVEQGYGPGRVEGIVVDGVDHAPLFGFWPEARAILQRVVPATQRTHQKL